MNFRSAIFLLLFLPVFTFSCRTDFDVNEEWKEIDIIYGLLDPNDSVHYVKIGKAFLNNDESAYKIAAVEDSLYHKDSLNVRLQEIKNGIVSREFQMEKTYLTNKESGVFASPGQFLYRLPMGTEIFQDLTYKILVKNTVSGVEASSQTPLVGDISNPSPSQTSTITFTRNIPRVFSHRSGANAKFYELSIDINYEEFDKTTNQKIKDGVVRWPIYNNYLNPNMQAGNEIKFTVRGDEFFKIMKDHIDVKPDVYRKLGLLDFNITGGGEEIFNYINVYRPSIGIVQKKPDYTNIQNGQGVFSSRNREVISVPVSSKTFGDLKTDASTSQLDFR